MTKPTPQPGDIVHVRATVKDETFGGVTVLCHIGSRTDVVVVPKSEILHIEPRPLKVGDKVEWPEGSLPVMVRGVIKGLDDSYAWLLPINDRPYTTKAVRDLRLWTGEKEG